MKISGCIVTYNGGDEVVSCIESILSYTKNIDFTLYVSDNFSTDNTVELIRHHFPEVIVLENEKNGGFGYGHNQVIPLLNSDYHCVINPDIVVDSEVISNLVNYLQEHSQIGLITPKILNQDGTEQYLPKRNPKFSYVILSKFPGLKKFRREYTRQDEEFNQPTEVDFCTGCFFLTPTEVFKKMGGFDDHFYMYFEDGDLSRRVKKAGYEVVFHPLEQVYHHWHRENTKNIKGILRFLHSMIKYFVRWGW